MRLVAFEKNGAESIGAFNSKTLTITDFSKAVPELPNTMIGLIKLGQSGLDQAKFAFKSAKDGTQIPLADVTLKAPIPEPLRDVMAVGRNYHETQKNSIIPVSTPRQVKLQYQVIPLYSSKQQPASVVDMIPFHPT